MAARLLDLVPERPGQVYPDWFAQRGEDFRAGVHVATLDPFQDYKNAIDDQLEDAVAVLDVFHVVKLDAQAVDDVRRRVQQQTLGHRGRKGDPLYGIRTILGAREENLLDRQRARLERAIAADDRHDEVDIACQAAGQLRSAYKAASLVEGRRIAEHILAVLPTALSPRSSASGQP